MQYKIYKTLCDIIDQTYPNGDAKYKKFFLDVNSKEMKSIHGDYNLRNSHIRIFNLSRPYNHIIITVLHEVSHHIDHCQRNTSDHSEVFYTVYHELLLGALSLGIIKPDDIKSITDSACPTQLKRYFGDIDTWTFEKLGYKEDLSIIKVSNSFSIKDILKERGYKYSKLEQSWCIEVKKSNIEEELNYLKTLINEENISVTDSNQLKIEAVYYVAVLNSFAYKDILKERGYMFNGYGIKHNSWNKKIKASDLENEKAFLNTLNGVKIQYKAK
ncbi:hypothetical protein ACSW9V_15175 (plasmid) [Clostridium perfringens]|uniref:hypothetical protein n=1 Tax=Clostridium perfringens TaxID=1502 RepID=UPI000B373448|nr:hypothetical protein [Clostridium perfringens]EGT0690873.1 hypothetical protein [Clostridium perfringens]EGT0693571.1 hypothetical protein [Clostridium perfringens]EGT0696528.1 hypothetical protein [Clostridium perfringens]MDU3376224.1 hypothetical protein [Clostridium perfringens]MDU3534180.1 hypothetical protein [Clostridium perfringens]